MLQQLRAASLLIRGVIVDQSLPHSVILEEHISPYKSPYLGITLAKIESTRTSHLLYPTPHCGTAVL